MNMRTKYYIRSFTRSWDIRGTLKFLKFSVKIFKFSLPWQQGLVGNFAYTVKFADPENPLIGARITNISPIEAQL